MGQKSSKEKDELRNVVMSPLHTTGITRSPPNYYYPPLDSKNVNYTYTLPKRSQPVDSPDMVPKKSTPVPLPLSRPRDTELIEHGVMSSQTQINPQNARSNWDMDIADFSMTTPWNQNTHHYDHIEKVQNPPIHNSTLASNSSSDYIHAKIQTESVLPTTIEPLMNFSKLGNWNTTSSIKSSRFSNKNSKDTIPSHEKILKLKSPLPQPVVTNLPVEKATALLPAVSVQELNKLLPKKEKKTSKLANCHKVQESKEFQEKEWVFKYDHYGKLLTGNGAPEELTHVTEVVAIDCEMVGIGDNDDSTLARISIVNRHGFCCYDSFVKPKEVVTDYRTEKSGVRQEDLLNAPPHDKIVRQVKEILNLKIVVGHAVHNDFKVLEIEHPWEKTRDTERYYHELLDHDGPVPLRKLCRMFLKQTIQSGEHSSIVDAQATMQLYLLEKSNWEAKFKETLAQTVSPGQLHWRLMTIYPREDELFVSREFVRPNKVMGVYKSSEEYLDTQFRLLREDFMKPLREGIKEFENWQKSKDKKKNLPTTVWIYQNVKLKLDVQGNAVTKQMQTLKIPVEQLHVDMSSMTEDSRTLVNGSLLLLTPNPPNFRKTKVAIVYRSEDDEMDVREGNLIVNFIPDGPTWKATASTTFTVLESVAFFEAYRHSLQALQAKSMNMELMSLSKYILNPNLPFATIRKDTQKFNFSQQTSPNNENLDEDIKFNGFPAASKLELSKSQYEAYHSALTKELTIIQGPPGTGKTYIALRIIQFFLCNENLLNKTPLVIVSNTNHSLDHLLEKVIHYARHLMNSESKGDDLILRIGGRSKSELVEGVSLFRKRDMFSRKTFLENQLAILDKKLRVMNELAKMEFKNASKVDGSQKTLATAETLANNSATKILKLLEKWTVKEEKDEAEFALPVESAICSLRKVVESTGMAASSKLLEAKSELIKLKLTLPPFQKALEASRAYLKSELSSVQNAKSESVFLKSARVLGMTVTGSAKYKARILCRLKPQLVIVEEAAHVIEATVVAGLTRFCKSLVLIGDHKQLRPSTADHELTKANQLDVSLMERFVKNAEAHGIENWTQLDTQRRMRPEISKLIHPAIYTTLHDHPNVCKYPNVRGVAKNLFFIDHNQSDQQRTGSSTFVNTSEADFIFNLCRYLVCQGNEPDKITIITTYQGQRIQLENLVRRHKELESTRVCCVDGFQGEENDIILLSLVRSNDAGKIGFLSTDNRVNVALSRARHGLYIVGNMSVLAAGSKTWRMINNTLVFDGNIGREIQLECKFHKTLTPIGIESSKRFDSVNRRSEGCYCSLQHVQQLKKKNKKEEVVVHPVQNIVSKLLELQNVEMKTPVQTQKHLVCSTKFSCGHICKISNCNKKHNYQCKETCIRFCDGGHQCIGNHTCYTNCLTLVHCKKQVQVPCDSCGVLLLGLCEDLIPYCSKRISANERKKARCESCTNKPKRTGRRGNSKSQNSNH